MPTHKIESPDLTDLEAFARRSLGAEHYPDDLHPCHPAECDQCGAALLELIIEHDEGDRPGDFHGTVWMQCALCGARRILLAVTSEPRKPIEQIECPVCECGEKAFFVLLCERIEVWDGVPSFFDEGVVAGKCAHCGRLRAFVFTD